MLLQKLTMPSSCGAAGSAQSSVWSVKYLYASTCVVAVLPSLLTKLISVGTPRVFIRTGPRYVSCTPVGQVSPATYPQVQVSGCWPAAKVPGGRTCERNSHMVRVRGPETARVSSTFGAAACGWMESNGRGWTNCGMAFPTMGTCGLCTANAALERNKPSNATILATILRLQTRTSGERARSVFSTAPGPPARPVQCSCHARLDTDASVVDRRHLEKSHCCPR